MYIALSGGRNGGAGEERVRGLVGKQNMDQTFSLLRWRRQFLSIGGFHTWNCCTGCNYLRREIRYVLPNNDFSSNFF